MRRLLVIAMVLAGAAPARADALDAAKGWLGALRQKDAAKLKAASGYPFTEAGIGPGSGHCGKRAKAANATEFAQASECMFADQTFIEALPPEVTARVVELKSLQSATFKKNMKSLAPLAKDHQFVETTLTGDAMSYQVLLAVRKATVTLVLAENTAE